MTETMAGPAPVHSRTPHLRRYVVSAIVVLLVLIGAYFALRAWQATQTPAAQLEARTTLISPATLEEQYGIRVRHVVVTAAGGLVELRYRVLDAEKAFPLLSDHTNPPSLIVDGTSAVLSSPGHSHRTEVEERVYYVHYMNSNGILQPGMTASIVMQDKRLEPIVVQ